MGAIEELYKFREEILTKFDSMILWAEKNFEEQPVVFKKPNRRLKMFMDEYQKVFQVDYQIRDHASEGGAAKRTEMKLDDFDFILAVKAYLSNRDLSYGAHFLSFIKRLEHWHSVSKGKK